MPERDVARQERGALGIADVDSVSERQERLAEHDVGKLVQLLGCARQPPQIPGARGGRQFVDQFLLKHEFVKRLHARYRQEGINIPFPVRTLSTRAPLPVTVVQPTEE